MSTVVQPQRDTERAQRRLPPITELLVGSLALIVVGGIVMATYIPRRPPLGVPIALLVASGILLGVAVGMLVSIREFAWRRFFQVVRWALLAYIISAGMIGYAFVKDDTRGGPLVVVLFMLAIFAIDVPLVIGFTVARHAPPDTDDVTDAMHAA